ncbi:hypothetical protein [Bifidobacterium oedipodis]|uniref:Uncharacterized protein n=1 Tax=Bifidobacterium oedipodis TaxID=2675322 RepID=A0A7Y0EP79_9BIFI|nr:hypothetical protein [Bifidobacterium sp. DSM 109957]NMM93891.1 hypothetical protein [Bifidobacterium sp. DSM 109957]
MSECKYWLTARPAQLGAYPEKPLRVSNISVEQFNGVSIRGTLLVYGEPLADDVAAAYELEEWPVVKFRAIAVAGRDYSPESMGKLDWLSVVICMNQWMDETCAYHPDGKWATTDTTYGPVVFDLATVKRMLDMLPAWMRWPVMLCVQDDSLCARFARHGQRWVIAECKRLFADGYERWW